MTDTISTVIKNLAVMEDLAVGTGTIAQERNGVPYVLNKIDMHIATTSVILLKAVDVEKFTRAKLYYTTIESLFCVYNSALTTGLASDTGVGTWFATEDNPVVMHANIDYDQANGGIWEEGAEFTFYDQYMVYNGDAYAPLASTDLPYLVDASPNPASVIKIEIGSGGGGGTGNTFANLDLALASDQPIGTLITVIEYGEGTGVGGNDYRVVGPGTGSADTGSFVNRVDGNQLQGLFPHGILVTQFGVVPGIINSDGFSDCSGYANAANQPWHIPGAITQYVTDSEIQPGDGGRVTGDAVTGTNGVGDFGTKILVMASNGFRVTGNGSSISGIAITTTTAGAAIVNNNSTNSTFTDFQASGFFRGVENYNTNGNKYNNVTLETKTVGAAYDGSVCVNDTWIDCTFNGTELGVDLQNQAHRNMVFDRCAFIGLQEGAAKVSSICLNAAFINCTSVLTPQYSGRAVFTVGITDGSTTDGTHIVISGGRYTGSHANIDFLSTNRCSSAIIGGFTANGFNTVVKTDLDTLGAAILSTGWTTESFGFQLFNERDKISGFVPLGDLSAEARQVLLVEEIMADSNLTVTSPMINLSSAFIGMYFQPPTAQYTPSGVSVYPTAGSGSSILTDTTSNGNFGTAEYTVSNIVEALKKIGIIDT